jgi:hypothetical protein
MSDSGWRARIRWVVVRPHDPAVLLLGEPGALALPEAELPGQVWTAEAEATTAVLRTLVGFDAVSLRSVEEDEDQAARVQHATLAAAPRGEAAPTPRRALGRAPGAGRRRGGPGARRAGRRTGSARCWPVWPPRATRRRRCRQAGAPENVPRGRQCRSAASASSLVWCTVPGSCSGGEYTVTSRSGPWPVFTKLCRVPART